MKSNKNERSIYIRSSGQFISIDEQTYYAYYRPVWAYMQKEQYHGRCCCPKPRQYQCDMDCWTCPYHSSGDMLPLVDDLNDDDDESDMAIPDDGPDVETTVCDSVLLEKLLETLDGLDPDSRLICQLISEGCSNRDIAAKFGISESTYRYRKQKLLARLKAHLESYI